jgi:tetratricopeptide (TPR) repeat protein
VSEEEAAIVFSEGKMLASRAGDARVLASLNAFYSGIRLAHGAEDHLVYAGEAVRLADESGDVALRRVVRCALVRSLLFTGHFPEALSCAEEAMDRLSQEPTLGIDVLGQNPYTVLAHVRADILFCMGRVGEGVAWFENALQRGREDRDLVTLARAHADYGGMLSEVEDPQVALTHARQGVELGEKASGAQWLAYAYAQLGRAFIRVGSYLEAVKSLERSREIVRESHVGLEAEPLATAYLAEAYLYSGEPDRALRMAEEAVARARQSSIGFLPLALAKLAVVLLRTKGLECRGAIDTALDEASRLSRQMEFKILEALVHGERAALAQLAGDEATQQRELGEAQRLFLEMGAPIRAAGIAREIGL